MKKQKSLILSLVLLFIPMMVIGCSSKPKVSADETAKFYLIFILKEIRSLYQKLKYLKIK
ncbi:hypothetical protein JTS96_10505 [Clostridium botulinum]|nr:hypothetical protein [Clostridium botulinum]